MKYLSSFSLLENIQQAKQFLIKNGIDLNNPIFLKIKNMIGNNVGYALWFCKLHFEKNVPFEELENIWNIIKTEPQIISKFKTPPVKLDLEGFWDEYLNQKGLNNAKLIYNKFPAEQKKYINLQNADEQRLLIDLYNDKEKDIFIKKISRYHSKNKFIDSLKLFLYNKADNQFDNLLKSLKDSGVYIVASSKEEDIIIATVDWHQIRKFGADTSWCIVGSKSTFDYYNRDSLSQQFIIFLLDRSDIYSKIGVTTSLSGYITAHLKNDQGISQDTLVQILKERGFDFNILLPTKETATNFDWSFIDIKVLQSMGFSENEIIDKKRIDIYKRDWSHIEKDFLKKLKFTDDEIIDKKRIDVSKKDWTDLSVEFLLKSGFTKSEIVKNKQTFGRYELLPIKKDLEYFTKEEIDKWKLLDKTDLNIDDLKKFKKEEIVKRKLLNRVKHFQLCDLPDLGFNFTEIRKFATNPKFKAANGEDRLIRDLIVGKSRRQIFTSIKQRSYNRITPTVIMGLIKIVDLKSDDMPFDTLIQCFCSGDLTTVEFLKFFGKIYELSKDQVKKIILKKPDNNKWISVLSSLVSDNLFKGTSIREHCEESSIVTDFREMEVIKDHLKDYPDLYQKLWDKTRKRLLLKKYRGSIHYDLKIRNDIESTIKNLNFWKAEDILTIEELANIFDRLGLNESIVKYLKDKGYQITDVKFDFINRISNSSLLADIEFSISHLIDVDYCYELLFKFIEERQEKLKPHEIQTIESLLKKRDDFEERWEKLKKQDFINESIIETKSASEYRTQYPRLSPENWYEKYWPVIKNLDFQEVNKKYDRYDDTTFVSTIVLLARVGKMAEADDINYRFIKESTYNRGLRYLTKIVADTEFTNSKRTFIELDYDERKSIFEWLDRVVTKLTKDNWEYAVKLNRFMLIDWYLFDRDKLNRYIEVIKKMKNNYQYYGRGDVVKYKTVRLKEVEKLLNYLAGKGKFKDIENILSQFKLTKKEKEDTIRGCWFHAEYSRWDASNDSDKQHKETYNKILHEYLVDEVKESFILKWENFSRKNSY